MFSKKGFKIFSLFILFIFVFIIFYLALFQNQKDFEPRVMIGKKMPNLISQSLFDNSNKSLDQIFLNEILVVNIFASWCAPCKIEHPFLMKLKQNNIQIIGINYKDNNKNAKNFLEKYKNPYQEVLIDPKGELSINLGVFGIPETFVVDKNFKIIDKHMGPIDNKFVNKILKLK